MNKDARVSMEKACESLREIQQNLNDSINTVENVNVQDRMREQLQSLEKLTKECQDIALDISNHG